eukprot:m.229294 g.229294  ORF g.229294 m.229294 type:complete len:82 (-) comp33557_c6_seq1:444-689(-)
MQFPMFLTNDFSKRFIHNDAQDLRPLALSHTHQQRHPQLETSSLTQSPTTSPSVSPTGSPSLTPSHITTAQQRHPHVITTT